VAIQIDLIYSVEVVHISPHDRLSPTPSSWSG
jgi:hypothetical protein